MTSSAKPEVHNLLHWRQKRTEPQPLVTSTENFVMFVHCGSWDIIQTDRQTDRHRLAMLRNPTWRRSNYSRENVISAWCEFTMRSNRERTSRLAMWSPLRPNVRFFRARRQIPRADGLERRVLFQFRKCRYSLSRSEIFKPGVRKLSGNLWYKIVKATPAIINRDYRPRLAITTIALPLVMTRSSATAEGPRDALR